QPVHAVTRMGQVSSPESGGDERAAARPRPDGARTPACRDDVRSPYVVAEIDRARRPDASPAAVGLARRAVTYRSCEVRQGLQRGPFGERDPGKGKLQ